MLSVTDYNDQARYYEMRKSWKLYFSTEILKEIDQELNKIDPNWQNVVDSKENLKHSDCLKSNINGSNFKSENYVPCLINSNEQQQITETNHNSLLWKVDIPDYPLFPEIGTDPRLLRRWYSDKISDNILINNQNYELLLNRIQPCILINSMLHAVRFYSKQIQLKVNGILFLISLVGPSTIEIMKRLYTACLGGPGHEIIILGIPYHVPFDSNTHSIIFNHILVDFEWIIESPIQVDIMPQIPHHISEWGWRGMFGSPKYLTQNPLNPMKPISSFSKQSRKPFRKYDVNHLNSHVIKKSIRLLKTSYFVKNGFKNIKFEDNLVDLKSNQIDYDQSDNNVDDLSLSSLCKLNRAAIVKLYHPMRYVHKQEISVNNNHYHPYPLRYQTLNDWLIANASSENCNKYCSTISTNGLFVEDQDLQSISFDDLIKTDVDLDEEILKWNIINIKSEEIVTFSCQNPVVICLVKGTAELFGTMLPFNNKIEILLKCIYEIVSFTGSKIYIHGDIKEIKIKKFHEKFCKFNILINTHHKLELKRIEASYIEGRGPRILVYGPGVDSYEMSTLARTLTNYAVRYGGTVGLVNLDTTYNDTGLPNSISVNVIHSEFDFNRGWNTCSDPLIFNFGQCSPVANQKLYLKQLGLLVNYFDIRCENDNKLLIGGCIINGGNFHSSDIIMKAIELFEVNYLLFISDDPIINKKIKIPDFVKVIQIPRHLYNTKFSPEKIEFIRRNRIESYFYGNEICNIDLHKHELEVTKLKMYYTKSLHDFNGSDFIQIEIDVVLDNSVGALSQASDSDQISISPILLYFLVVNISVPKSTITVLTKEKIWPNCFNVILFNGLFFCK